MARKTKLQILRTNNKSNLGSTTPLSDGELLYDKATNKLFIGTSTTLASAQQISAVPSSSDDISVNSITINGITSLSISDPATATVSGGTTLKSVKIGATNYNMPASYTAGSGISISNNQISVSNTIQSLDNFKISATADSSNYIQLDAGKEININTPVIRLSSTGGEVVATLRESSGLLTVNGNTVATEGYVDRATSAGTGGQINYLKIGQSTYTLPKVSVTSTSGSTIYNLNINGTNYSLPQGGGTAGVTSIGGKTGAIGTSTDIKVDSSNNLYLNSVTDVDINCLTKTATFGGIVATGATIDMVTSSIVNATTVNADTLNATTIKLTHITDGEAYVSSTIDVRDTDGITGGLTRSFLYSTDGQTEERIPTVKVLNIDPSAEYISSSYAGIFTLAIDGNKWRLTLGIGSTSVEIGKGGF